MIREAARGRGERGLGKFDSNPSLVGAHPVPVSIGGGGAGRQVEQVEKEACCCAAIERQTPRALLSLGGGSKLEGCGPRVNAFLLYYATQLEPNPLSLPPSSNRLGKFRSTVIQTRVQPKKNAPRDACSQRVHMYVCIRVSIILRSLLLRLLENAPTVFLPLLNSPSFLPFFFLFQDRENFSLRSPPKSSRFGRR